MLAIKTEGPKNVWATGDWPEKSWMVGQKQSEVETPTRTSPMAQTKWHQIFCLWIFFTWHL